MCVPFLYLIVQVLTPLQGGLPQQTGVIIQPQQIVLASGNKVQSNTQVSTSSIPSLLIEVLFCVPYFLPFFSLYHIID